MEKLKEILHNGGYSCVIQKDNDIRTFIRGGVIDIFETIENDLPFLNGASVADKVVGKAAAALMILSGVSNIYADVISESAIQLLKKSEVTFCFGKQVPAIQNREKNGICPLENICSETDSLQELFLLIENFIESKRK